MLIETWIAVMMIVFVFIGAFVSIIGWISADRRNEEQHKSIICLTKENKHLIEENEQLKSKLSLIRLRIDMEEKK